MKLMPGIFLPAQTIVIGDKQIHARRSGAGKLDGIGRLNALILTNLRVMPDSLKIEIEHSNFGMRERREILVYKPRHFPPE